MTTRTDLLNFLCSRYESPSYLEIGCAADENFDRIDAPHKVGVDPVRGGTHPMTSDVFFDQTDEDFDVVFIDGLHLEQQVTRDFANSERHLNDGGVIVLHDCLPPTFQSTDPSIMQRALARGQAVDSVGMWCGEVWRAVLKLRRRDDLDIALWPDDLGCAVVLHRPSVPKRVRCDSFEKYQRNYAKWLHVVESDELEGWL